MLPRGHDYENNMFACVVDVDCIVRIPRGGKTDPISAAVVLSNADHIYGLSLSISLHIAAYRCISHFRHFFLLFSICLFECKNICFCVQ